MVGTLLQLGCGMLEINLAVEGEVGRGSQGFVSLGF